MKNLCTVFLLLLSSLWANAQANPPAATPEKPAAPPAAVASAPMPPNQALPLARQYAEAIVAGKIADLWPKMTSAMQGVFKTPESATTRMAAAAEQIGHESKVLGDRVMPVVSTNLILYTRLSDYDKFPSKMELDISLDPAGNIAGFTIRPVQNPAESKYLDYQTKARLRFPLTGEWTVYQGGRSVYDNYHAAYPDERFAYDILLIRPDGRAAASDITKLEDYFGFGQPVVAPAAGKVVAAVDQYDDNPIGKPIQGSPKQGNNVVIDHGNGEFSMFAHLKRGSVKVKAGDEVKAGQALALVGNSGNSPVPHLHYHLQTTPDWFKGDGLPTPFQKLTVNGKKLASAEPVRGDVVKAE